MAKKQEQSAEESKTVVPDMVLYGYMKDPEGKFKLLKVPFDTSLMTSGNVEVVDMHTTNRSEAVYQLKVALAKNGVM